MKRRFGYILMALGLMCATASNAEAGTRPILGKGRVRTAVVGSVKNTKTNVAKTASVIHARTNAAVERFDKRMWLLFANDLALWRFGR